MSVTQLFPKPSIYDRNVSTGGIDETAVCTMSGSGKAFGTLINNIYSDKFGAAVREIATNGMYAHREAGRPLDPIHIQLPTILEPELIIRDFGHGISHHDMMNRYKEMFSSTRESEDGRTMAVGLGIGRFAPLSIVDAYTITSWHEGRKGTYTMFLNQRSEPAISLLAIEDSDEPSGLEVRMPISNDKFIEAQRAVQRWTEYFDPLPKISPSSMQFSHPEFAFQSEDYATFDRNKASGWSIVQGNVRFAIDPSQITLSSRDRDFLHQTSGVLFTTNAEIAASREAPSYDEITTKIITDGIEKARSEYVTTLADEVINCATDWQAMCRYNDLYAATPYTLVRDFTALVKSKRPIAISWPRMSKVQFYSTNKRSDRKIARRPYSEAILTKHTEVFVEPNGLSRAFARLNTVVPTIWAKGSERPDIVIITPGDVLALPDGFPVEQLTNLETIAPPPAAARSVTSRKQDFRGIRELMVGDSFIGDPFIGNPYNLEGPKMIDKFTWPVNSEPKIGYYIHSENNCTKGGEVANAVMASFMNSRVYIIQKTQPIPKGLKEFQPEFLKQLYSFSWLLDINARHQAINSVMDYAHRRSLLEYLETSGPPTRATDPTFKLLKHLHGLKPKGNLDSLQRALISKLEIYYPDIPVKDYTKDLSSVYEDFLDSNPVLSNVLCSITRGQDPQHLKFIIERLKK